MLYEKIIVNIAFLIVSAYTYGLILKLLKKDGLKKEAITGCLFGLISILSMIYSFKINAGLIFDGRSIILGLSGIIGGIFSAVISVIIALFYRILLGGDGTITGVLVILVSGLIGGLSHAYLKKVRKRIKLSQVYALGLLIHLITILLFFTIPGNNSASIIKNLLIPFLVFFPIATVLIYILFVDQRIRMENKVRLIESENKFRTAFEQSASGMCITSLEGQLVKVNAPLCKILGYQKKELEGSHFNSITHKNDIDIGKEFINKMLNNKADSGSFEKRYIHKSSHVIWININSALIRDANNEPLHFITQIEDITERKLFEKKIFDSKKETERYLDMTQSIILVLNAKGEIQIINQKGLDILEYEREELIGENWFKTCIPKEELDKVLHVFDKIIRGKAQPQEHIENEIITKSGKRKKIAWYNTFLKNEKEKITSTLSSGQDITERKNAEEKLRLSEERFSTAFNVGPTGMTITRISDGKFINVNNYFLELFEFSRDEVIEHTSTELNMWTTEERQKIINAQVQLGGLKSTELSALTKSGKKIDILFSSKPIELQNEAYLITTLIDLTSKKKTETELKESETKYYTLFDYAPYGILIANTESYYLNANKSMCKMLGLTLDELVGKHATDIVMPIEYKYINPALKEIQSDKNYQKEWIFKRKDGSTFIGDVMVTPMPDGNLMAIVIDITERKQINEVIQRQAQIMNQIHGAIIATDLKGIIVDWNNGAIRMFEYTKDEALGKPITFIYPEDQLSILTEKIQPQVRKSGWYETEVRLKSKSGKEFPVHISLAALKNPKGDVVGMTGSAIDISERKQAEDEIKKLNEELEQRVIERTSQLESANNELQAFTYSVSHDLKAPLRGIDGYSKLLQDIYSNKLDQEAQLFINNIRNGTKEMNQLIEDLLAYSRLERKTIQEVEIDLKKLIKSILGNYAGEIEERKIMIVTDIHNSFIIADFNGLSMIVRNLLENAIKFTKNIPAPIIKISTAETEQSWTVVVEDNGIGFDMKYHDKIFEIFQRLYHVEEYPGTGIGLALVSKAIKGMGGTIKAESSINKGAKFIVEIPKKK